MPSLRSQAATLQQLSPCDVAALEKCLKENKGDREKVRGWPPPLPAAAACRCLRRRSHTRRMLVGVGGAATTWCVSMPHALQCLEEINAFQRACSKAKPAAAPAGKQ